MNGRRVVVSTDEAPRTSSPISQGIIANDLVFCSGQGPFDPGTGLVVGESIEAQTARTIENLRAVLAAAGCTLEDIVKVNCFLKDRRHAQGFNDTYRGFFAEDPPARATVVVADLLVDMLVEIEAVALRRT